MSVWTVVRRHWLLVTAGVLVGGVLAFLAIFKVGAGVDRRPAVSYRPPGNYVTTLNAVIDTSAFGLGSSDTDLVKLSYVAPTYAELMTSEPVIQSAAAKLPGRIVIRRQQEGLGSDVDVQVSAAQVGQSPIVQLTVDARNAELATRAAIAVVNAFKEYLATSQQQNTIPVDKRLVVLAMGEPTKPQLASNRQREFAVALFCLPIAVALVIAYRMESSKARRATGLDAEPAPNAVDLQEDVADSPGEGGESDAAPSAWI